MTAAVADAQRRPIARRRLLGLALLLALALAALFWRQDLGPRLGATVGDGAPSGPLQPTFDGPDAARARLPLRLEPVASGYAQVTDLQFLPDAPDAAPVLLVLQKEGALRWHELATGKRGEVLRLDVRTRSEQGLLGLAFHPQFARNRRVFLNYVIRKGEADVTRVARWRLPADFRSGGKAQLEQVVLEVEQPYVNHNAGQLAFGPDGMLYVGLGDGGSGGDPHGHGQNRKSLLGKMLRLDVDKPAAGKGYGIPADNPFAGDSGTRPEIWASGLRNPWRYAFDGKGRLVVADVGQNDWEEIDLLERGGNFGWNRREGRHCFPPGRGCEVGGLVEPFYEYGRADGGSITGGYVYEGKRIPALRGRYVFADFSSGRLWAVDVPARNTPGAPLQKATALGRFPIAPATFGRDAAGELYVADFGGGVVYRLTAGE